IAVPVAAPDTLTKMSKEIDDTICLLLPRNLGGIGAWYQDFTQTEDKEVLELLEKSDRDFPVPTISAEETAKLQNETIIE
ncbi:10343_t:CDS:2, partial [Cetraspora pellucida]